MRYKETVLLQFMDQLLFIIIVIVFILNVTCAVYHRVDKILIIVKTFIIISEIIFFF